MTEEFNNDIVNKTIKEEIEVAFFISIPPDVSGAGDDGRKERMPKRQSS